MTTAKEIFNYCLGGNVLVNSSLYFSTGNSVVRFADHKANPSNFQIHNDGVKAIFLVYVNANLTEGQIQSNVSEIERLTGADVDYTYFEEGDDIEIIKAYVNRFISSNQ